jgi:hypothetical protein
MDGYYKKKGPVWKYSPFLNPISYEKPNRIRQAVCRDGLKILAWGKFLWSA